MVDTCCTLVDDHHHFYVLSWASDQLGTPRPTPGGAEIKGHGRPGMRGHQKWESTDIWWLGTRKSREGACGHQNKRRGFWGVIEPHYVAHDMSMRLQDLWNEGVGDGASPGHWNKGVGDSHCNVMMCPVSRLSWEVEIGGGELRGAEFVGLQACGVVRLQARELARLRVCGFASLWGCELVG